MMPSFPRQPAVSAGDSNELKYQGLPNRSVGVKVFLQLKKVKTHGKKIKYAVNSLAFISMLLILE